MNEFSQNILILSFIVYLVVVFGPSQYYAVYGQNQNQNVSKYGINNVTKPVGGIQCDKIEHLVFHNHTKLVVKIQNKTQNIPGGLGIIPNNCIFWLHTHDESGIIHIESPVKQTYTLGQFLTIWKTFDSSSFINNLSAVSSNNTINIFNNGVAVAVAPPSIDFNSVPLKDKSIITLDIRNVSKN
jgi:hypothetical protein